MKREIITYLGSNLILNNQKLTIEVKKPLQVISNRPEDFKVIMTTLESLKILERRKKISELVAENIVWGE